MLKSNPAALATLGADLAPIQAPRAPHIVPAPLSPPTPGSFQTISDPGVALSNPMVMTDGSVIAHESCTGNWYKLSPNSLGKYEGQTWQAIATMPTGHTPRFFSSAVLPDGRFIVEGGEYNTSCAEVRTTKGSIYDPKTNTWASVTPPTGWAQIGNSQATVLADGTYYQANCCDSPGTTSALLNATTLTWTATGTGKADYYDEEGWTLLPNGKLLTVDAYVLSGTCGKRSEFYDPSTGAWTAGGNTPTTLADCDAANAEGGTPTYEMGPQVLMYNGKVIAFGANTANTAHTALYDTSAQTWANGPDLPSTCGSGGTSPCTLADAPAALLPNGNVLFAASAGAFHAPVKFFEYTPGSPGSFTYVATDSTATSFQINLVMLPTGQVMKVDTDYVGVQLYNPSPATFSDSLRPVITGAPSCVNVNTTHTLNGKQLNGLSEDASYGDDAMANTNFPLVKIVNDSTGDVSYARTFSHSSRSITPNAASSTKFFVKPSTETGASTMYVIANGIPSLGRSILVNAVGVVCPSASVAHDFNADAKSDILWHKTDGSAAMWLMNGTSPATQGVIGTVDTAWQIAGTSSLVQSTGDFNADGKADLLWRKSDGTVAMWLMNGITPTIQAVIGTIDTTWQIAGTGDFDGDGKADILWRKSDGTLAMWLMNGTTPTTQVVARNESTPPGRSSASATSTATARPTSSGARATAPWRCG